MLIRCGLTSGVLQEQYVFIYSTLVEALLFGGVSIPCATYKPKLEQLASDDDGQGTRMARMYKVQTQLSAGVLN